MPENVKILLTGARGVVGNFLLPSLSCRHFPRVYVLGRQPPTLTAAGREFLAVDLEAASQLQVVCRRLGRENDALAVLHLAPLWLLPPLLEQLLAVDLKLRRLVAFSSTSVVSKETSPAKAERALAARLRRAEKAVIAVADREKVPWTIFRPTLIYDGQRDRNVVFIKKFVARFGFFPLAGRGCGRRQPVHAADLAAACLAVLANPRTYGRIYALGGGEILTYREMVARIGQSLGRPVRFVSLPEVVFVALVRLCRLVNPGFTVGPAMVRRMNEDLVFADDAARRDFAFRPRGFSP